MLEKITLKSSSSATRPATAFNPGAVTVLVGPNNSGKTLFLQEVEPMLSQPTQTGTRIIGQVVAKKVPDKAVADLIAARGQVNLEREQRTNREAEVEVATVNRLRPQGGGAIGGEQFSFRKVDGAWSLGGADETNRLAVLFTLLLDGRTRLALLDQKQTSSTYAPPPDHLAVLFREHVVRRELARLTHDAFGEYLTIDATSMQYLSVQLSRSKPPDDPELEISPTHPVSRAFHKGARPIGQFSDGVKAYIGILAAVIATEFRLILIDEPEAFLHPMLSQRLGRHLGEIAKQRDGGIIAATHDADFLMGAVQSGAPVTVVRLTYSADTATSRVLEHVQLKELMMDPLLRSTGVLRALFHAGAVVCEADADRAFYQECNERLLTFDRPTAAADTLFLGLNGKDVIHRVVAPLRAMGIPAAALVDVDILKKDALIRLLKAACVPPGELPQFEQQLDNAQQEFVAAGVDPDADGLKKIAGKLPPAALALLAEAAKYGVFVVPVGEVENWLPGLGVTVRKKRWLPAIFAAMKDDPAVPGYVKPGADDVWQFLRSIAAWIGNPARLGIPP